MSTLTRVGARAPWLIAVVLAGGAFTPSGTAIQLASAAAPAIAFEVPRVADPIHTYGEPNIDLDPNNPLNLSISGPTGTGTQRSIWQASVDGGRTFRNIHRVIDEPATQSALGPLAAPGGGDTELIYDSTGKEYFADLYALACQHVAARTTNPDGTETVQESPTGGCPLPGSDRQWMLARDPNFQDGPTNGPHSALARHGKPSLSRLTYMETNNYVVGCNGASWYRTTDGLTYVNAEVDGPGQTTKYCPFGADGYPSIDQETGKVFQANYSTVNGKYAIRLNIGTPVSAAGDLCFLDAPATSIACPKTSGLITVATDDAARHVVNDATGEAANFVVTSMDQAGNLWAAWVNKSPTPGLRKAYVTVASAATGWKVWATPVEVSAGLSKEAVFPWVQAGGPGRADVVWYGDSAAGDPSSTTIQHVWNVDMAQVVFPVNAAGAVNTAAAPLAVSRVKVTPHPMDLLDICLAGTACVAHVGNRNLADFFELRSDPQGAAMVVYDDMSNGLCELCPGGVEGAAHMGAPVVNIGKQASGPGLYGTNISGTPNTTVKSLTDDHGDARWPLFGGTNVPSMDLLRTGLSLAGSTLTITTAVAGDVRDAATTGGATSCLACNIQYVTRWQMGTAIYYGMLEVTPTGGQAFYAGSISTVDDCSVSACDPHIVLYPESGPTAHTEAGEFGCPAAPSVANPCTFTERINVADVGAPTAASLLEQVGSYAFKSHLQQDQITQATERADGGAEEVDGICCFNFGPAAAPGGGTPGGGGNGGGTPNTSAAPAAGLLLVLLAVPLALARRARRRANRPAA